LGARVDAWFDGLESELEARKLGGPVRSVYVGGGTPSVLEPEGISRLFAWIDRHFDRSEALECTVELNPEHVTPALLAALEQASVGRVSLGVQSLARQGLQELGRAHDAELGRRAISQCAARFETSVDFILGWTGQRFAGGETALIEALEFVHAAGVEHLSLYALTIEAGSSWPGLVRRGLRKEPDDESQAALLDAAEGWLVERDWVHYEVSSYARGGKLAEHNRGYWTWRDYLGMGPSAGSAKHSRGSAGTRTRRRTNPRGLQAWLEVLEEGAGGEERLEARGSVETLEGEEAAAEGLWLGLRRLQGIDLGQFLGRFPQVDEDWLRRRVSRQLQLGNLEFFEGGRALRVAPGRWTWHDSIAVDLVASERDSG
jgi:oxygen-independent coproporphyrinogen-3 oxidase